MDRSAEIQRLCERIARDFHSERIILCEAVNKVA